MEEFAKTGKVLIVLVAQTKAPKPKGQYVYVCGRMYIYIDPEDWLKTFPHCSTLRAQMGRY